MGIGLFNDKNNKPTDTEVSMAIGSMLPVWDKLTKHIRENYQAKEDFRYLYGKDYGWALRFRINGKLLTSLYPVKNGFTIQLILNPAALELTRQLKLSRHVRQVIAKAHPYPEGKWLFIPVNSDIKIQDIKILLELRCKMKNPQKR